MNQQFDASGEGLALSSRTLKPYEGSLYGLLAALSALFMRFRQRKVMVAAIAALITVVFLAVTLWVFSASMDGSRVMDPVDSAGQLYF